VTRDRFLFLGILAVLLLGTFGLLLAPRVSEWLGPEPVRAWVAIETPDSAGVARVGRHEVEEGTLATLHAVLEAEGPVYYTEARALEIEGRTVPAEQIRPWGRHLEPRILWFTVEGAGPFLKLESPSDLESFHFTELFRPEWPRGWRVPAGISSKNSSHLRRSEAERKRQFGIQRYHVRIDLVDPVEPLVVKKSARSWGADEVLGRRDSFPTLVVELPKPLTAASRFFGLTQLIPSETVLAELSDELAELAENELAFSRAHLLRAHVESAGRGWAGLEWIGIDWAADRIAWGERVRPGDLLRVGDRAVILYQDLGVPGVLDDGDLCFDFERGAMLVGLGEIFTGGGLVEWASL
jgi:hypothetical protein